MRKNLALALALLSFVSSFATAGVLAAFSSQAGNGGNALATGKVVLTDNDGGTAMLSLASAALGASDTSCIRTTYSGSVPSEVRHHASVSGTLAPYLTLRVTRGTGGATYDSCSDFVADSTNYIGKGPGVIYEGKLSGYPTSWAAGIVDPAGPGSTYSSLVAATPGLVSYWRLGDNVVGFDDLTDPVGVPLENHAGGLGATWTKHSASTSDTVFSDQNRVRRSGTEASLYYTSTVPSSADYAVEADVHVKSAAWDGAAVIGRASTSANTYYRAGYFGPGGVWELYKVVDGTSTLLGSYAQTLTAGSDYRVTLAMQGSTIYLFVDGVQRVVATDTSITTAGRGGVRLGYLGATSTPDNTSGLHLDNFRITSLTNTAADSKGTNTGYYGGIVQLNQPGAVSGETDRATRFDGTSGKIEVPSSATLQLTGNFSIEAWVKPDAVVGTRWILQKGTLYYLYLSNSDVVFGFWSGGSYRYVVAPGAASVGAWQHFVGTYDGSMVRIYKNGVQVASAAASGTIPTNATNLSIANLSGATTNTFTGTIDEVALYNTALAPADIAAHYATGGGKESWTNPETHAYKFEITVDNDAAALGKSATATFTWEARNL